MSDFTHLHVHSEYSLLDGLARIGDLVATAKSLDFDALALTDHGVMYGAVQFYKQAVEADLKPIIGCELYVATRSRTDTSAEVDRRRYHLTVLAENDVGYRNLVQLVSRAQLEGFYYKPRVDREILAEHSDGLIVLSGCPSGEVARHIQGQELERARETLGWYKEVFAGRYYVELMSHDIDYLPALNRQLVAFAEELDLPLVATNDVHYARKEDVGAHEVLLCIQTGKTITDPDRIRIGETYYMRSTEEMRELFSELPQAIANTAAIAERCNVEFEFGKYKLPVFHVPEGETTTGYLSRLCREGLAARYGEITDDITTRLNYELDVIHEMGFEDYFLIVWDLCRFSREQGIWWNVRGSGAGSIVAYALQITNIDPLAHGLIFERFLNPDRISMPDIDLDFPDDQRDVLIRYSYDTYGHDRVAQIITFGTLGARAAIRDAGRALDLPFSTVDSVARLMPSIPGKPCGLKDALDRPAPGEQASEFYTEGLVELYETDGDVRKLLDTALSLEGVARHASTHAAGVVIADRPLTEYLPLHRATRNGDDTLPVTQFPMKDVDQLGLLKIDFLGLSTLTVLRRASELVERYHGRHVALDNIPLDDPQIYDLLSSGNVTGVFQVEGAGMRRTLREMHPRRFEDVVATIALYRPGPMDYIPAYIERMHGRQEVTYKHPDLVPILSETYGILVYQEQIIRIATDLAGYSAGEADTIRKAVGKKNKVQLLRHRSKFIGGATQRGISKATAEAIFGDIETFARYGFNKAHAADYAVIVCQTAWFKAHYPVEYMAALLSVDRNDTDKIAIVATACHRMGIVVLPPDVGRSDVDFSIEPLSEEQQSDPDVHHKRGIRFGLAAIKNVGESAVHCIVEGRDGGIYETLDELCRGADLRAVGKRAMESLVRAGALDRFGSRGSLLAALDAIIAYSGTHHAAQSVGQMSLFGEGMEADQASLLYPLPEVAPDPEAELDWEKELMGIYLSEHPLQKVAASLADTVTIMIGDIDEEMIDRPVVLGGIVSSIRPIKTKTGQPMAFVGLEDLQGSIELIVFPRVYQQTQDVWEADKLVLVRGKVESRDDRLQIIVDAAEEYSPETSEERSRREQRQTEAGDATPDNGPTYYLTVTLATARDHEANVDTLAKVYEVLTGYPGRDRFTLVIERPSDVVELEFPNSNTRYCVGLLDNLKSLIGDGRVEVAVR